MKHILLAAIAALTFGTIANAGGDIAPIEEPVVVTMEVTNDFYVGGALTAVQTYVDSSWFDDTIDAKTGYGLGIQGGYVFYRGYDITVAAEARLGSTLWAYGWYDADLLTYSALLKPQYNFGDFGIYGLAGYGVSDFNSDFGGDKSDGFVWGGGAAYAIDSTWSVFVDYTVNPEFRGFLPNEDVKNDTIGLGFNYSF